MAKSKRKPAAAVKRSQVPLQAPVPSHTNQGGSLVLGLKSALGTLDGAISHIPRTDLPPSPAVIPSNGADTSTAREVDGSPVGNTNVSFDGFLEEDCSADEELGEEQLDFSCSEEDYETSPLPPSPAQVANTIKELMSYPKCRSVTVINNPVRPGSNHREVNCINYN